MEITAIHEAVNAIHVFDCPSGSLTETKRVLDQVRHVRGWLDARAMEMTARLRVVSSFPEHDLAVGSRSGQRAAVAALKRSETVSAVPELGAKLADGSISNDHLDVTTRELRRLKAKDRPAFQSQGRRLAAIASQTSPEEFEKRAREIADAVSSDRGEDLLVRQRAAARFSSWFDTSSGMWRVHGQFDPETGTQMQSKIEAMLAEKFSDKTPEDCPEDPGEKQGWLRAQAFAAVMLNDRPAGRTGRPETVVVVDTTNGEVRWPFAVTLPDSALQRFINRSKVYFVGIHIGGLVMAPGRLNLGRDSRQANRAQRRALGVLYQTCAIPGCCVRYDLTKLHHIVWWRHGGLTDLDNLLPLCDRHHQNVHNDGWLVALGPQRQLTLTLPDGRIMKTGPPGPLGRTSAA